MPRQSVYDMPFTKVYEALVAKAERKGRTRAEVDDGGTEMNTQTRDPAWDSLTYEEKNKLLYDRQKAMLDEFLEHGAISRAQHDKSLHDLTEKMAGAGISI